MLVYRRVAVYSPYLKRVIPRSPLHPVPAILTDLLRPKTRLHRTHYTHTSRVYVRSSSGILSSIALSAIALSGAFVFYNNHKATECPVAQAAPIETTLDEEQLALMAGTPLPGRPGNLTSEQEEKLIEFWNALLHVFGVPDLPDSEEGAAGESILDQTKARSDTIASDKKGKKKRGGLFKKDKDGKTVGGDGASAVDGEDKWGQNKEFLHTLETYSPEDLRQAFWSMVKHDNPDALLLRFLRARKWNIQNALVMLIATMQWRMAEVRVDSDIVKRGEAGALEDSKSVDAKVKREGHDFMEQMRIGKSFLHGVDKEGRPMCFVRVKLHKAGEQTEGSLERYTVYTIETARLLLHGNVDTAAIVFDMTDFSLANMDYAPVKFMIKCFEANYPESLGVVLVHKSPWIFQSIWKIIKGWLDPVVAAKIHFTKNVDELSHFVPMDHLLQESGGKEKWSYQYIPPKEGENKAMEDTATRDRLLEGRKELVKEYESTTQRWLQGDKEVSGRRRELTEKLRTGYWELDPYLRARTYYDRLGMINAGGKIEFYPPDKKEESLPNGGPIPAGHVDGGVD